MELHEGENPVVARAVELANDAAAKVSSALAELDRASRMATIVARLATAVSRCTHVGELADVVFDHTLGALGALACGLFIADLPKREVRLASQRAVPPDVVEMISTLSFDSPGLVSPAERHLAARTFEVHELAEDSPIVAHIIATTGARRIIWNPLIAGGELVGVLFFFLPDEALPLSADNRGLLEAVASVVGVALSNTIARDCLASERARLATILQYAPHGIVYLDAVNRRTSANPAAVRAIGMTSSEWGPPDHAALPVQAYRPDGSPMAETELPGLRALHGETVSHVELVVEGPNGRRLPMIVSASPVIGRMGRIEGSVIAFEDISALKELDRLRAEFSAIVTHDLRNPIAAILMTAEMALEQRTGDGAVAISKAALERIRQAAQRLGAMVKDLLDASRIEIGRVPLDRRPIDAGPAIQALVAQIRPTLGDHAVELDAGERRECIFVDPLRFDQIVTNVLENAAKYSATGAPIIVRVRARDAGVELAVEDHGIGIPADEIPFLFDRFYQARRARKMRKGLGLGLYITKGLVDANGGRITVESEVGHGTTFRMWFPRAGSDTPAEAPSR